MSSALQIFGAIMILAPFAALQLGALSSHAPTYLWPNLVGSVLLGVLAAQEQQWGFLLLEICWGAVAAWGLVRGVWTGRRDLA